jgi:hypothetical protein
MSAPGIQLNSQPQLTYFQPTVRQYLQSIKEAVMSNDLTAAQQAFAQLIKAAPSLSPGSGEQAIELATRVSRGLQAVGSALKAGDLPGAGEALGELRQTIQPVAEHPAVEQSVVAELASQNSSQVPSDGPSSDQGPNLSVRA